MLFSFASLRNIVHNAIEQSTVDDSQDLFSPDIHSFRKYPACSVCARINKCCHKRNQFKCSAICTYFRAAPTSDVTCSDLRYHTTQHQHQAAHYRYSSCFTSNLPRFRPQP